MYSYFIFMLLSLDYQQADELLLKHGIKKASRNMSTVIKHLLIARHQDKVIRNETEKENEKLIDKIVHLANRNGKLEVERVSHYLDFSLVSLFRVCLYLSSSLLHQVLSTLIFFISALFSINFPNLANTFPTSWLTSSIFCEFLIVSKFRLLNSS